MKSPGIPRRSVLALALALAACSTPPPHPIYPDIRFTAEPPIRLDVAAIDIRDDYRPPLRPPNVEHLFPVPPARALENWARDRLQAAGKTGRALFTIGTASATETALPKTTTGITGALTTEPAYRYDLSIEAKLQILDDHGVPIRTSSVRTSRSQSVLEGISPDERDKTWYDMTVAAMGDFDKQMAIEMGNNFGQFLLP